MERAPLVELPGRAAASARPSRRPLRARDRRWRDEDACGGPRPREQRRCTLRTAGRATRTRSAPRPPCRRCWAPPTRRSRRPGSRRTSSARRCSRSPAPTPTRSSRTCAGDARRLDRRQRRRRRVGHGDRPRDQASRRSRGPARTSSASAPTDAAGAPAVGGICSATRARATGSAWSRSGRRCATARHPVRPPRSATPRPSSSRRQASRRSPSRVYAKPLTKGEIAAFAIETAKLAEQGDAVARELYERGAGELGKQIAAVIRESGLDGRLPGRADRQRVQGGRRVRRAAQLPRCTRARRRRALRSSRWHRSAAACCSPRAPAAAAEQVVDPGALAADRATRSRAERPASFRRSRRRASTASRPPIAVRADARDAHRRGGVREGAARPRRGRPSASATNSAAANTSPAPRSSRACSIGGTASASSCPPAARSVFGRPPAVTTTTAPAAVAASISRAQLARSCALTTSASQRAASASAERRRGDRGDRAAVAVPAAHEALRCEADGSALSPGHRGGVSRATGARCRMPVLTTGSLAIGPAHASSRCVRAEPSPRVLERRRLRRRDDRELELRRGRARAAPRSRRARPA